MTMSSSVFQSETNPALWWETPAAIDAWRLAHPGDHDSDYLLVVDRGTVEGDPS